MIISDVIERDVTLSIRHQILSGFTPDNEERNAIFMISTLAH